MVVAQLVEQSLMTKEVSSLHLVIGILYLLLTVFKRHRKRKKEAVGKWPN